jgi:hypothetical protein
MLTLFNLKKYELRLYLTKYLRLQLFISLFSDRFLFRPYDMKTEI